MSDFKKCCATEIKKLWEVNGGSMNIVNLTTNCPTCGQFIGLTQTDEKEAERFLKKYNLCKNES